MKRFILKLSLFAAIMLGVDICFGIISDRLFIQAQSGEQQELNYIANQLDDDIVFMGSSRCALHYDPRIIADSLGMSVYNGGHKGLGIIYAYGELQLILQHHKPKAIIYDIFPPFDLYVTPFDNNRDLKPLRRFYDMPSIKALFIDLVPSEQFKMLSQLRRNNEIAIQLITGAIKAPSNENAHGFRGLQGKVNVEVKINKPTKTSFEIDSLKLKYFNKFIDDCFSNNIALIFIVSPGSYDLNQCEEYIYQYLFDIADKRGIPVINNYLDGRFVGHVDLFKDVSHMNIEGAEMYSSVVATQLKPLLNKILSEKNCKP